MAGQKRKKTDTEEVSAVKEEKPSSSKKLKVESETKVTPSKKGGEINVTFKHCWS
jgi:hypothetical protein